MYNSSIRTIEVTEKFELLRMVLLFVLSGSGGGSSGGGGSRLPYATATAVTCIVLSAPGPWPLIMGNSS